MSWGTIGGRLAFTNGRLADVFVEPLFDIFASSTYLVALGALCIRDVQTIGTNSGDSTNSVGDAIRTSVPRHHTDTNGSQILHDSPR